MTPKNPAKSVSHRVPVFSDSGHGDRAPGVLGARDTVNQGKTGPKRTFSRRVPSVSHRVRDTLLSECVPVSAPLKGAAGHTTSERGAQCPAGSAPGTAPITGLVVLTAEQVTRLAYDAAAAALAEFAADRAPAPELVDGVAMARLISVSRATLHRLRVAGAPAIPVGDTFRYRPAAVIGWLEEQGGGK